jgi:polysaccharide pyruvyl transferase WcaK-like protein
MPISFLLTGNGPVSNRGCEAIVLGTKRILEREFGDVDITLASFASDPPASLPVRVRPLALNHERPRWSRAWWRYQFDRALGRSEDKTGFLAPLRRAPTTEFRAALSIGGDGYSLGFGRFIVDRLVIMDRWLKAKNVPVVVWGASIGPFDREPDFEQAMVRHLHTLDAIVVRERDSLDYLHALGLRRNVWFAPDPAFALEPVPVSIDESVLRMFEQGCIGLNLSPLLARFVTQGSMSAWVLLAARLVEHVARVCGLPVVLVPHVTFPGHEPDRDDALFLERVLGQTSPRLRDRVAVTPGGLRAGELKWLIAQTRLFIGARAHATIAALSSEVPCLLLAYSRKAWGISELVYGHRHWVVGPSELSPEALGSKVRQLLDSREHERAGLARVVPGLVSSAFAAARVVRNVLNTNAKCCTAPAECLAVLPT